MGQKLRKMVMRRAALCDLVVNAAKIQGPAIGRELGEFLSPAVGESRNLPDLEWPIELFSLRLQSFCNAMVEADANYLVQRSTLADLRVEAEAPTRQLKSLILSLRFTCEGLLGKESLRSLSLDFNLAQNPRGVLRQGEIIRERLLGSDNDLLPVHWIDSPLIRRRLADDLNQRIGALATKVRRLVAQGKVVDIAKVRKDQTQQEFDHQFIPIARWLEATFRVAGETELADRIRPTARQLGRSNGRKEESASPEDAKRS